MPPASGPRRVPGPRGRLAGSDRETPGGQRRRFLWPPVGVRATIGERGHLATHRLDAGRMNLSAGHPDTVCSGGNDGPPWVDNHRAAIAPTAWRMDAPLRG